MKNSSAVSTARKTKMITPCWRAAALVWMLHECASLFPEPEAKRVY